MIISFFRTIILYFTVICALRLMGKRQIGEMQPSELVVAIMISDLASIPMGQVGTPIISGIVPIATLVASELMLSFITLKSTKIRHIVSGQPSVIISQGIINQKEMARLRLNIEDLMEQLRTSSIFSIGDVEYAILETNGQISIIPKAEKASVTPSDMGIKVQPAGLSLILIADGEINNKNLEVADITESKLKAMIKQQGSESVKDVFLAVLQADGSLFLQQKQKNNPL